MVERYVALAYDKGVMQSARDLPQPLLWPRLQVSEAEKQQMRATFRFSDERPVIGFCPGAEFGPAKRWPHYHYAALAEKLIHSEEDTRKQLARELHDEIGQNITAIQIQSQLVKRASDTPLVIEAAGQINDLARRIHHSTRQLLRQLRPPVLDELSLQEALHHLVNEFAFAERGIRCRFDYRLPTPPESETLVFTLYRLLQELLNNVCKHANASEVTILLCQRHARLYLEVHDNGSGISPQQQPGFGIQGMRERVSALGGELTLESRLGTRVIVNLPTNLQQTPL